MIEDITARHFKQILKMNAEFVHWLAPLGELELHEMLSKSAYAKQVDAARGVLIGYGSETIDPTHENLTWLQKRFQNFFYIDRVIVDSRAQGQGYAKKLYLDVERFAREAGYFALTCEVNIVPDNPPSHQFHKSMGFIPCGTRTLPIKDKALLYYYKPIF